MEYLLGIDGGGTQTTAWLADSSLSILSRVHTGPSNPVKVGIASAQRQLARAYRLALQEAYVRPGQLSAVCAGIAGSAATIVHKSMRSWLSKSIPARSHLLTTDALITLAAAFGESEGIVVIAGTGSIAYGRDQSGLILRAGGWGSLFDDAGSGYDLGRKAVACALRGLDGRGKPTRLTKSICSELRLRNIAEIVSKNLAAQEIAALFPAVLAASHAGDVVARTLCHEAARDLAALALTLVAQFKWKHLSVPIACSGGVFQSSPSIRRRFARHVHEHVREAQIFLLRREPVEGALYLASRLAERYPSKSKF